jgi:transposase-like protein
MRKHYTEAQRAALIGMVTTGQASLRGAAARLGVADSTAYYWVKRAKRTAAGALVVRRDRAVAEPQSVAPPTFARLVRAADTATAITLRVGGAVIEVRPGFDAALLHDIVVALAESAQ